MNINIKDRIKSFSLSKMIISLLILLIILAIFQAGFLVGYRKGVFADNWGKNYTSHGMNTNDPRSYFSPLFPDSDDVNPHGAIGQIVSMNLPTIMIKGPGRAEEVIVINKNTIIRNFKDIASTSDLTIGKPLIVIGQPQENGEISASLIRIMPEPPALNATSSTQPY